MHCLAFNVTGLVNCDDPYPCRDGRTCAASQLTIWQLALFSCWLITAGNPSLYYLEQDSCLYQFSLRLNLNARFARRC
jgi:hypothetical protein